MLAEHCQTSEINTAFSFPNEAIFILERNLIGADFDHVLGNHF